MSVYQTIRHIRRRQHIVGVLLKNGLGYIVQRFGLSNQAPVSRRGELVNCRREPDELLAYRLREAFVELGPTFVKLGQVLSTRPDLLPPVFIEQLERLQDKVRPMSYEEVEKQLIKEIGHPQDLFQKFDREPLAAASIGQVHRAVLSCGAEVIVKIQRPNIERVVEDDLQILSGLARLSERRSLEARRLGIYAMIDDYAKMFRRELDYAREARNTERMFHNFRGDERVRIPRVYWEYTTPRVLTEEYIEGIKLSDVSEMKKRGWDVRKISQLGTETFLSQIILHGFFQADPHPGNILVISENQIAFIDFGEIGTLADHRLITIGELLVGISKQDMDRAMAALQDIGITETLEGLQDDFQEDFEDLVKSATSGGLGNLDMNRLRKELMALAYKYQLKMPAYLTSLMKALITVEGVGKKLDPGYDFMEAARPLGNRVYQERIKPGNIYKYLNRKYYRDIRPLGAIPVHLNSLLKNAATGQTQIKMLVDLSDKAYHRMSQLISRLSVSLIITGGLIGSALIIQASHPAVLQQYAVIGVAGFGLALLALIIFFVAAMKS